MTTLDEITESCQELLNNALKGKTLGMFGEDGNGQHGRSSYATYAYVNRVTVFLEADDHEHPGDIHGIVEIDLSGYDSHVHGHAVTDQNLRFSLNDMLKKARIDPTCLDWGVLAMQGRRHITLSVDVVKLMNWA